VSTQNISKQSLIGKIFSEEKPLPQEMLKRLIAFMGMNLHCKILKLEKVAEVAKHVID